MEVPGFWAAAVSFPDRVAVLLESGSSVKFGELGVRVNRLSRWFGDFGVASGDIVACLAEQPLEILTVQLATLQIGAYFMPLGCGVTEDEANRILRAARPRLLVGGASSRLTDLCTRHGPTFLIAHILAGGELLPSSLPRNRSFGDVIFQTSGSTGQPRAVVRPLRDISPEEAIRLRVSPLAELYGLLFEEGRHLLLGPLTSIGPNAAALRALHLGHSVVLPPSRSPQSILATIEQLEVTSLQLVPTVLELMLAYAGDSRDRHKVSSLRSVVMVGARCAHPTKVAAIEWLGPIIHEVYSSTEVGMTYISSAEWLRHRGSVGRPIHGSHIRIVDDAGLPCSTYVSGHVYMKRDGESFEYLGDPEATHSSRIGDFVTVGDEGFLDDAGRLYLTGRTVERLSSGGLKVYPAEIEEALTQDPAVIHAVATGVPDRCLGDRIVAAVTLRPRVKVNDVVRRLHALCRRQLAAHKRPTHILVCNIPCLENGKIDRVSAREILWSVHIPRTMTVNEA